jgi:hypothetical protein
MYRLLIALHTLFELIPTEDLTTFEEILQDLSVETCSSKVPHLGPLFPLWYATDDRSFRWTLNRDNLYLCRTGLVSLRAGGVCDDINILDTKRTCDPTAFEKVDLTRDNFALAFEKIKDVLLTHQYAEEILGRVETVAPLQ